MKQMKLQNKFLIHLKTDVKTIYNQLKVVSLPYDYVHLLYYKHQKINLNGDGSHIDYPD